MSIRLSTLEGINTVADKLYSRQTPRNFRNPGRTRIATPGFALYGTEVPTMQPMSGLWSAIKSVGSAVGDGASSVVRGTGGVVMDVGRSAMELNEKYTAPMIQAVMNSKTGGATSSDVQAVQSNDLFSQLGRLLSGSTNSVATIDPATGQIVYPSNSSGLPSWALPVGLTVVGLGAAYLLTRPRPRYRRR